MFPVGPGDKPFHTPQLVVGSLSSTSCRDPQKTRVLTVSSSVDSNRLQDENAKLTAELSKVDEAARKESETRQQLTVNIEPSEARLWVVMKSKG